MGTFRGPGGKAGGSWVNGNVVSCAIGGCTNRPTVLASGGWGGSGLPSALALDATRVYWTGAMPPTGLTAGGAVLSCSLGGCGSSPSVLASGVDDPTGVAVSGDSILWTEYDVGSVVSCPLTGCTAAPASVSSSQGGPTAIIADASGIYWVNYNGSLKRCASPSCTGGPTTLWVGQGTEAAITALAADNTNLYWTNGNPLATGSVFQCAKSNCAATAIALASERSSPMGIAVDATDVYWIEGGIYKCAIGGCGGNPTFVAAASGPAIAVDGAHIYASTSNEILVIDK